MLRYVVIISYACFCFVTKGRHIVSKTVRIVHTCSVLTALVGLQMYAFFLDFGYFKLYISLSVLFQLFCYIMCVITLLLFGKFL